MVEAIYSLLLHEKNNNVHITTPF